MREQFNSVRTKTLMTILRQAGWDPQSHDKDGFDFVNGNISSLIDSLDCGAMGQAWQKISASSRAISEFLNDQGYYRSVYNKAPMTKADVENILRDNLGETFNLPAPLQIIE